MLDSERHSILELLKADSALLRQVLEELRTELQGSRTCVSCLAEEATWEGLCDECLERGEQ